MSLFNKKQQCRGGPQNTKTLYLYFCMIFIILFQQVMMGFNKIVSMCIAIVEIFFLWKKVSTRTCMENTTIGNETCMPQVVCCKVAGRVMRETCVAVCILAAPAGSQLAAWGSETITKEILQCHFCHRCHMNPVNSFGQSLPIFNLRTCTGTASELFNRSNPKSPLFFACSYTNSWNCYCVARKSRAQILSLTLHASAT